MKSLLSFITVVLVLLTAGETSCKKDDYLTDGGKSKAYTELSTYDYLASNRYHVFDTTLLLIDHFNLKDAVNSKGTFFAFTDYSISAFMTARSYTSLQQLYDSVDSKLITQYMFSDSSITLDNATTTAKLYTNLASDTLKTAVKKIQQSYTEVLTSSAPVFNYYTLQYVKINGALDDSQGAPDNDVVDNVISCQTSGIKTSSGTTLHVLANNALLNKL